MGRQLPPHRDDHGGIWVGGIAEGATDIAKMLFYIFLVIVVVVLVAGVIVGGKVKSLLGR
jgi:uncharacterized membrane protein YtjA (UPF0391 family)